MSDDQLENLRTKKKAQVRTDLSRQEQAALKLYDSPRKAEGIIQIPSGNLFASLKGGGRKVSTTGKAKVSTATSSQLPSFITIEDEWLDIVCAKDPAKPAEWVADMRKGTLKAGAGGGVAVAIVRPKFASWQTTVNLEVNLDETNEETLKAVFTQAGKTEGLCSFRPSKGGQFGMYRIADWKELPKAA
jgi:hypothetical protein